LLHILVSQLLELTTTKTLKQGIHCAVTFIGIPVLSLPGSSTGDNMHCYRNVNNYQVKFTIMESTFTMFVYPSLHSHVISELRLNKFSWNLVLKILTKFMVLRLTKALNCQIHEVKKKKKKKKTDE
jgi:galactitol-specific phosphotransferase system IIC component